MRPIHKGAAIIAVFVSVAITPGLAAAASWSVESTPNPPEAKGSLLNSVSCSSSTACTAVGWHRNSSGQRVALAERWNGTEWSIQELPSPPGAKETFLYRVSCASSTECVAVGGYVSGLGASLTLALRWDGTKWSVESTPNPASATSSILLGVSCASSTSCMAVGWYAGGGVNKTLAARWNGTSWSLQEPPNPAGATTSLLIGVSCTASNACTAVGNFNQSETEKPLAANWNGLFWSIQEPPIPPEAKLATNLRGVSCISATACMAAGQYYNGSANRTLAQGWNGFSWSTLPTPNPAGTLSVFTSISCPLPEAACTAVGRTKSTAPLAEAWDGSSWSIQETAVPAGAKGESILNGVSCVSAEECIAVGRYENSAGVEVTLAEHYE